VTIFKHINLQTEQVITELWVWHETRLFYTKLALGNRIQNLLNWGKINSSHYSYNLLLEKTQRNIQDVYVLHLSEAKLLDKGFIFFMKGIVYCFQQC